MWNGAFFLMYFFLVLKNVSDFEEIIPFPGGHMILYSFLHLD